MLEYKDLRVAHTNKVIEESYKNKENVKMIKKFDDYSKSDNMVKEYLLFPIYDTRKSFYGKARIVENYDRIVLYSYNTPVAMLKDKKALIENNEKLLTQTTMRHIKEFLLQEGFKAETKQQMLKDYGIEV